MNNFTTERERERCKKDVCMYCSGRAIGYKRIPDGPNEAGNWTHQYMTTMRTEDRVMCKASAIFAREAYELAHNDDGEKA